MFPSRSAVPCSFFSHGAEHTHDMLRLLFWLYHYHPASTKSLSLCGFLLCCKQRMTDSGSSNIATTIIAQTKYSASWGLGAQEKVTRRRFCPWLKSRQGGPVSAVLGIYRSCMGPRTRHHHHHQQCGAVSGRSTAYHPRQTLGRACLWL
jgi:hypothetical protein